MKTVTHHLLGFQRPLIVWFLIWVFKECNVILFDWLMDRRSTINEDRFVVVSELFFPQCFNCIDSLNHRLIQNIARVNVKSSSDWCRKGFSIFLIVPPKKRKFNFKVFCVERPSSWWKYSLSFSITNCSSNSWMNHVAQVQQVANFWKPMEFCKPYSPTRCFGYCIILFMSS